MINDVRSNLYPCAHCDQTGTCEKGLNKKTCATCVSYHKKFNSVKGGEHAGLPCGICGGLGLAEPGIERLTKRWPLILSLSIISALTGGLLLAGIYKSEHFTPLLTFAGPLVGGIVGFYYRAGTHTPL